MRKDIDIDELMIKIEENHMLQVSEMVSVCPVCGVQIITGYDYFNQKVVWKNPTQKAHLLSNDVPNKKKYGKIIIDHRLNHALVCSLKCNNDIQVRNNPMLERYIVLSVMNDMIKNHCSIKDQEKLYKIWCNFGCNGLDNRTESLYFDVCNFFMAYENRLK